MRFGVFDHNDASGRPPALQIAERLSLVEDYERLGFYAYHMAEHHGTGDPAGARSWVARHRDVGGISYMALELCFGDMTPAETLRSAELFATEVMPAFT